MIYPLKVLLFREGDGAVTPTRLCLYTGARQDGVSAVTPTLCREPDPSAEIASAVPEPLPKILSCLMIVW